MAVPPVWVPGQVLDASDVNTWFVGLPAIKNADTARATNTTPAADPDLAVALAASASYRFMLSVSYKGGANGSTDAQVGMAYSGTATTGFYWMMRHQITSLTLNDVILNSFGTVTNVGTNGTSNPVAWFCTGAIITTTSGTLSFNWCQQTSSGTAVTVMAGSHMLVQRLN
jgi:hypothetical protein